MNPRRTMAIARAHTNELMRRKLSIALLLGMPMAFYFAAFDDKLAISFATIGFGWSVAIIALFSTHSITAAGPRLALVGYRPAEIIAGRLLSIAGYALVLGTPIFLFLKTDYVVITPSYLAVSLGFAFLGSCVAGLAVGVLIHREMEAMLVLIGLVALTLVVDWKSPLAKALPMYASNRYSWGSVDGALTPDPTPWPWTLLVSGLLALIAITATFIRGPRPKRA